VLRASYFAVVLFAVSAFAHPAVGIVADARGNIFYSDLSQVWRIAPDGSKSVAVPHVHTHELYLDAAGNLFGEHVWYNGEQANTWGHYVWMRSPTGVITKVIPDSPGFLTNYSFVRDRAGNMYFAVRERNEIRKRAPDGKITTVARAPFRNVRWMTATPEGVVYLIDLVDLVRIGTDGRVTTIARNLGQHSAKHPELAAPHLVMGLWTDRAGNVYAADAAGGVVKRVDARGNVTIAARSTWPWFPTGGTFAPDGAMWLLESTITNDVRARKVR
jgi:hypothetical protein